MESQSEIMLQLLIYAALWHKKSSEYLEKISIYNPLLGNETIYTISAANIDTVTHQLNSYEIGINVWTDRL